MNALFSSLKPKLDLLYRTYDNRYLNSDPVRYVHRYRGKQNREIAGILSAVFAYGNVNQICTTLDRTLQPLGPSPFEYVMNLNPRHTARTYAYRLYTVSIPEKTLLFFSIICIRYTNVIPPWNRFS